VRRGSTSRRCPTVSATRGRPPPAGRRSFSFCSDEMSVHAKSAPVVDTEEPPPAGVGGNTVNILRTLILPFDSSSSLVAADQDAASLIVPSLLMRKACRSPLQLVLSKAAWNTAVSAPRRVEFAATDEAELRTSAEIRANACVRLST